MGRDGVFLDPHLAVSDELYAEARSRHLAEVDLAALVQVDLLCGIIRQNEGKNKKIKINKMRLKKRGGGGAKE